MRVPDSHPADRAAPVPVPPLRPRRVPDVSTEPPSALTPRRALGFRL